jgi:hypothetical protein
MAAITYGLDASFRPVCPYCLQRPYGKCCKLFPAQGALAGRIPEGAAEEVRRRRQPMPGTTRDTPMALPPSNCAVSPPMTGLGTTKAEHAEHADCDRPQSSYSNNLAAVV